MLKDDPQIGPADLDAYVDDQLTQAQRAQVEAHLSRHPDAAARVMRDLSLRRDLRRALAAPSAPRPLLGAARRLATARRRDAQLRRVLRIVPAALLVGLGWLAHAGLGPLSVREGVAASPAPASVTAALSAHQVSLLRLDMTSQPGISRLDPVEMRAATGIVLPRFPDDWTVRDAQVFPSPQGPGIELVFDSGTLGRVTHFAVRTGSFAVTMPHAQDLHGDSVAWFQIGETAHVLIADRGGVEALEATARRLSATLY